MGDSAEHNGDRLDKFNAVMGGIGKGIGVIVGAAGAAISGFLALGESTQETQQQMALLEHAFESQNLGAEAANDTLRELQGILGDTGRSVESANLLAKMSENGEDLAANTRILTGVFAEFGDSIPTEGLAEGMQATAEMGSVQGVLADALEWQGINLDDYNAKLASMSTSQERAAYVQQTLTDLYGDSADAYRETNQSLIAANEAQLKLDQAMAQIGEIALPIVTQLKDMAANLLIIIEPFVQLIGEGLTGALNGSADAATKIAEGLSGLFDAAMQTVTDILPTVVQIIAELIPKIVNTILEKIPELLNVITDIAVQVINVLTQTLPQILVTLAQIIPQIVAVLIQAIPELLAGAIQFFGAIIDAIPKIIDALLNALPELINTVLDTIVDGVPLLLDAAIRFLTAIIDAIPKIIDAIVDNLPKIITTFVEGIVKALPKLLEASIKFLGAIIDAIPKILPKLIVEIPKIVKAITETLAKNLPVILKMGIQVFTELIKAIPEILPQLIKALPEIIQTITETLLDSAELILESGITLFTQLIEAIPTVVRDLARALPDIIYTIVDGLADGVSDVFDVGQDIIRGLWEGISDMADWIARKIKGFGEGVLDGIKDFFGINSPSKVMADQVGKYLTLGIGQGFSDNIGGVNRMMQDSIPALNAKISGSGIAGKVAPIDSGGVTINQYITNTVPTSRLALWKTQQDTLSAVKLAIATA